MTDLTEAARLRTPKANVGDCALVYRTVSVRSSMRQGRVEAHSKIKVFDTAVCAPEILARAAMDDEANAKASVCCKSWGGAQCVYVISANEGESSKIGVTGDPLARLASLQTANWQPLTIAALFWLQSGRYLSESRLKVEATALRAAREMGVLLSGEWVDLDPIDAAELVVKAAKYEKIDIVDSAQWIENTAIKAADLAAAAQASKRINRLIA